MSVIGNAITLNEGSKLALALSIRSSTPGTALSDCNTYTGAMYWSKAFTNRTQFMADYTCRKAGTYKYLGYCKGGYNSSGTSYGARIVAYKNGTSFLDMTSGKGGAGSHFGIDSTLTIDLAVGDVITIEMANTNTTAYNSGTFFMELVSP